MWEQYQIASTIFEFFQGWERAFVDDDSGLVVIEGAGFAPSREYVCLYYDNAVIEVRLCCKMVHLYVMLECCRAHSCCCSCHAILFCPLFLILCSVLHSFV